MPGVLSDTTVLSNFAHVRRPDLLRLAYDQLRVPQLVMAELEQGVRLGIVPACDWSWVDIIEITKSEQAQAEETAARRLESGEAVCIAIARARGLPLLTDDRNARRLAHALGLEVSGTLGVLSLLIHRGTLSLQRGDALLKEMIKHGYRSPVGSLREVIP